MHPYTPRRGLLITLDLPLGHRPQSSLLAAVEETVPRKLTQVLKPHTHTSKVNARSYAAVAVTGPGEEPVPINVRGMWPYWKEHHSGLSSVMPNDLVDMDGMYLLTGPTCTCARPRPYHHTTVSMMAIDDLESNTLV